jgi:site-specific recombinase XerD
LCLLLIDEDGAPIQPLALWLTEAGMPMQFDSWENVFADACARCGRFGVRLSATPHTLRHTFAVHMLTQLVKQHLARTDGKQADPYRAHLTEPLRKLQIMLGHKQILTTFRYLDTVAEAQEYMDEAIETWEALMSEGEDAA